MKHPDTCTCGGKGFLRVIVGGKITAGWRPCTVSKSVHWLLKNEKGEFYQGEDTQKSWGTRQTAVCFSDLTSLAYAVDNVTGPVGVHVVKVTSTMRTHRLKKRRSAPPALRVRARKAARRPRKRSR